MDKPIKEGSTGLRRLGGLLRKDIDEKGSQTSAQRDLHLPIHSGSPLLGMVKKL